MKKTALLALSLAVLLAGSASPAGVSAAGVTSGRFADSGIRWTYDRKTDVLTYTGTGYSILTEPAGLLNASGQLAEIGTIVVEDIRQINCKLTADTIVLDETVEALPDAEHLDPGDSLAEGVPNASMQYEVDPDNLYFAAYDGALYTKDLTELIRVPKLKTDIELADTLEKIDTYAFMYSSLDLVVIPWGVTEIEERGVEFFYHSLENVEEKPYNPYFYVVLPDTLQTIGKSDYYTNCRFIYSDDNAAVNLSRLYPATGSGASGWRDEALEQLGKDAVVDFYDIKPDAFQTFGNKTYYFDGNRKMLTGNYFVNGTPYAFDQTGALEGTINLSTFTGLIRKEEKAYYYTDGVMEKNRWIEADGNWYYLNDHGAGAVSCWRLKDGKYCYLKADGKMASREWVQDYGNWYYVRADGSRCESCWAEIGGIWYWFGGSGKMARSEWLQLDGRWYYFTDSGAMAHDVSLPKDGKTVYVGSDGAME